MIEDPFAQLSRAQNCPAVSPKGFTERDRLDDAAAARASMFERSFAGAPQDSSAVRIIDENPSVPRQQFKVSIQRRG